MRRDNLTVDLFDRAMEPPPRIIWGADAIAARISRSPDFVRNTLAHLERSPVKKIGNRYAAHEGDLIAFFRA